VQAFEQPHAEIHALAGKVEVLKTAGQVDQALQLIERARLGLLGELIAIFERTRQIVREQQKEVGIVVHLRGRAVVLVVDRAEAVADLEEIAQADDPLHGGPLRVDLVPRLARWRGAPQPVLVLDLERVAALGGA
jgi:hypothetical protein